MDIAELHTTQKIHKILKPGVNNASILVNNLPKVMRDL